MGCTEEKDSMVEEIPVRNQNGSKVSETRLYFFAKFVQSGIENEHLLFLDFRSAKPLFSSSNLDGTSETLMNQRFGSLPGR